MQFFRRLLANRPRPFKVLQQWLGIQEEWALFRKNLRPHKAKIFVCGAVLAYPLYQQHLNQAIQRSKEYLARNTQKVLAKDEPLPKVLESYVKQLVDSVLKDKNIKQEAAEFVSDLSKRELVLKGVLDLLLSVVKNPVFIQEAKHLGSQIVINSANDKQVEHELKELVLRVLKSYQVQQEVTEIIRIVFSSSTATRTLVRLLVTAINEQPVKESLAEAVKYSFRELLNDRETVEQFKYFGQFLLEEFQKDVEKDRIMTVLVSKGIGLDRNRRQQSFFLNPLVREDSSDNLPTI